MAVLSAVGMVLYLLLSSSGQEIGVSPALEATAFEHPGPIPDSWRVERSRRFPDEPTIEPSQAPHFDRANRADQRDDPQVQAMHRTLGLFGDAGVPPFHPLHMTGRLKTVEGVVGVVAGAQCEVRVLPVRTSRFNCLVRVTCDDVVLYPDDAQTAGYVPCDLSDGVPSRAVDTGFTESDGDPTIVLDTTNMHVQVSDFGMGVDNFTVDVELEI